MKVWVVIARVPDTDTVVLVGVYTTLKLANRIAKAFLSIPKNAGMYEIAVKRTVVHINE